MYHIAVRFDVPDDRRQEFIAAALDDGRQALATEPGTRRYELISDEDNLNRFYLYEVYEDAEAFTAHLAGAPAKRFFELINEYAVGPTWLIRGDVVEELS
jgi:(4S)-4-hydroxy-5-phosphonooxypentane-2,3-dione isomerase